MRIQKAKDILRKGIPAGEPILLTGRPGIGKTSIIKQVCKELGYELKIFHPVLDDRVDYKGLPAIKEEEAEFLPFGNLKSLVDAETPTVAFFDDLGQAPGENQAAIMQLILGRELNGIPISDSVVFVAATNRKEDKAGVSGMLSPLLDRFLLSIPIQFHIDDWALYMTTKGYDPSLVAFSRFKPSFMTEVQHASDMEKKPSPRSIEGVGRLLRLAQPDTEILSCAAGQAWATEYMAYRKVTENIPDVQLIWDDPKKAPIPKEAPVLYGLMSSLAHHVSEEHIDPFLEYLMRVSPEFAVVAFKDSANKLENVLDSHPKFFKWVQENDAIFAF